MVIDGSSEQLAEVFGHLALSLQAQQSDSDTLKYIVDAAAQIVPGARWAGISLIRDKVVVSEVPTSREVAELDQMQSQLDEGPCLDALREHHTVRIDDMRTETRWPRFTQAAERLGILSALSFQLFVQSENLGALNLYAGEAGVFSDDSVFVGGVLAQHAAVALVGAAAERNFDVALASRDVIGQAKGLLMAQNGIDGLAAFALLVRASQQANKKLVDIARWIVDKHESTVPRRGER